MAGEAMREYQVVKGAIAKKMAAAQE